MPRRPISTSFLNPSYVKRLLEGQAGDYWIRLDGGTLPWPILVRLGVADGRLVVTGMLLGTQDDPPEITSRALRLISVPDVTESIAAMARRGRASRAAGDNADVTSWLFEELFVDTARPHRLPRRRPGPRGLGDDHFREVAAEYRRALISAPRSPIAEVGRQMKAPAATARRWVARARDKGYLERSPIGRAGEERRSEP